MTTKEKVARAERRARKQQGFEAGERLSARCARLDDELTTMRADVGARGEPAEPSPKPALDASLPSLLLNALLPVEAVVASAAAKVPYGEVRTLLAVDEEDRRQLTDAAQAAAAAHADFIAEHSAALTFASAFMAVNAARVDALLTLAHGERTEVEEPRKPCSWGEAVVVGLLVLAPALLLTGLLVWKLSKGE